VLNRRDFVEAAPALPTDPWLRLPPASPCCYDSEEMDGLSPPSATGEVGPERPVSVTTGGFLRAASRTRRAPL